MSSQKPSWIGQTLAGRYKIETLLGQGGMSAVYKATDPNLRRTVAIKLIHPHLASDEDFVRRFEEEAAAVASLRHANIIQVYDFSHDGDTYYMVLEYLPGESLDQRLIKLNNRSERLDVLKSAEFMHSLCSAVAYAHDEGMIHRDLKPANVMITPNEQVVLMDFGIAKIMGGESHTATGALVGTIVYMSPEQIRGEAAGPSSDIYALGIILYEMVTGRRPFQGENTAATMMAHLNEPIPDARQYNPSTPNEIIAIIEKALAKNPGSRYQTAHEMAHDLRQFLGISSQVQSGIRSGANPTVMLHPETEVVQPGFVPVRPGPASSQVSSGVSQADSGIKQTDSAIRSSGKGTRVLSGLGLVFLILVIGGCAGIFFLSSQLSIFGEDASPTPAIAAITDTPAPTEAPTEQPATDTPVPTAEDTATAPAADATEPPAAPTEDTTPQATATRRPTQPPPTAVPFQGVQLTNIREEDGNYVIDYRIVGFALAPIGVHLHFYFNNITENDAGIGGTGPYIEYDGLPPFVYEAPDETPFGATQVCAVMAGRLHQIRPGSSSCIDIP